MSSWKKTGGFAMLLEKNDSGSETSRGGLARTSRRGPVRVLALFVAAALATLGTACTTPGVHVTVRNHVPLPPAPSRPGSCALRMVPGPLPPPGRNVVPVARLECRYVDVQDRASCERELRRVACNCGANTLAGLEQAPGFVAVEAIYAAYVPASSPPPGFQRFGP